MRMAFGFVSLLVTLGIIILVMSMMLDKQTGSIPVAISAREEAKQIAGIGQDGEAATQSAYFEEGQSGGKFTKLIARQVRRGGAYDTYFGLLPGDEVVEIEQGGSMMKVNDISNGDPDLARALISDAYARQQRIIVVRNGQRLTLPLAPGTVIAGGGFPTTAPTAPAPAAAAQQPQQAPQEDNRSSLTRQLDAIKGAAN
jgi:hypothetical protein